MAAADEARVLGEIERGRRSAGLTQTEIGRPCQLTRSSYARLAAGGRRARPGELACLGAVVALEVRTRAFPAGDPIRDAGHVRLLGRLRGRLSPALEWRTEVPVTSAAEDQRAWDAVITGSGWRLHVEAETVLDDLQALDRRLALKRRDGNAERVLVVVAATHRNRRVLAGAPAAFAGLSRDARSILRALADGHDPELSGIVLL